MKSQLLSLLLPAMFFAVSAQAQTVIVPSEIPYADGAEVREAVRNECELPSRLAEYIEDGAGKGVEIVLSDSASIDAPGQVLLLEITYVLAPGGGAFSGPKSVTVRGELYEDGEVIGSFTAARYSSRGNRTCTILNRCIRTIGSDIGTWLENPTMDAKLGNA